MTTDAELQTLLAQLFPEHVGIAGSVRCPDDARLLPDEQAATQGMVASREREFRHGRHCARLALTAIGAPAVAIRKNDDRSPQWPAGYIGSISHTGDLAAAAVAAQSHYVGLGLDIERNDALDEASHELILRAEERSANGQRAKLIFSIKEAIYKCLYTQVGAYIDFQEMEVAIDESHGRFRAIPHTDKVDMHLAARLQGRYCETDEWVFSSAWIAAEAAVGA